MDDELGRPQPGPGHSAGYQARRAGGDRVDARLQHLQLDPEIQQRRGEHVPATPAEASTQASPTPVGTVGAASEELLQPSRTLDDQVGLREQFRRGFRRAHGHPEPLACQPGCGGESGQIAEIVACDEHRAGPESATTRSTASPLSLCTAGRSSQTILPGTTSNPRRAAIRPAASSIGPAHRGGSTIRRVWTATA